MTRRIPRSTVLRLAAAGLGVAAFAAPFALAGEAAAQTEVKVAMIAPLSGPWARQGELMKMGADMAIEEINAKGGIAALGGAKIKLIVADAGDTAEKAKNAAERLLAQHPDLTGATGSWLSSFTLAVTEVTERAELPVLTLSYSDVITQRGHKFVFQTSPTAGTQATEAMPTILKLAKAATGKDAKTVALINDNTASPVSFTKPMREGGLEKLGLKAVVDEVFTPPLSDATPLVQAVRRARPDVIMLITSSIPDTKLFLEKLNEFKVKAPVIGNGAPAGAPDLVNTMGKELLEGLMFSVANWGTKGQEHLIDTFTKRSGEPWMTQDTVTTYGDMWIFKQAMEDAKSADRRKVAEAIRKMDVQEGPAALAFVGGVKFEENGRRAGAPLVIAQWQNGKVVTVFPIERAQAKPIWPTN